MTTATPPKPPRRRTASLVAATAALAAAGLFAGTTAATADRTPTPKPEPTPTSAPTVAPIGDRFARTELFFGTDKPGPDVTDAQFRGFVNRVITPRFPDGLTQFDASGQFKDSSGRIVRERAKVVILLYPADSAAPSSVKIEEIRDLYEEAFEQESVLRADSVDLVSF